MGRKYFEVCLFFKIWIVFFFSGNGSHFDVYNQDEKPSERETTKDDATAAAAAAKPSSCAKSTWLRANLPWFPSKCGRWRKRKWRRWTWKREPTSNLTRASEFRAPKGSPSKPRPGKRTWWSVDRARAASSAARHNATSTPIATPTWRPRRRV